jgi:hypothetical protein
MQARLNFFPSSIGNFVSCLKTISCRTRKKGISKIVILWTIEEMCLHRLLVNDRRRSNNEKSTVTQAREGIINQEFSRRKEMYNSLGGTEKTG